MAEKPSPHISEDIADPFLLETLLRAEPACQDAFRQRPARAAFKAHVRKMLKTSRSYLGGLLGKGSSGGKGSAVKPNRLLNAKVRQLALDYALLKASDKFDEPFYVANNPDVGNAPMTPAMHYLLYGSKEGRSPSAQCDVNPGDALEAILSWERHGKYEAATSAMEQRISSLGDSAALLKLDKSTIGKILENPAVTSVSFSLIDGLLCFPFANDSEIFWLADALLRTKGIEGFREIREQTACVYSSRLYSLDHVYAMMEADYNLEHATIKAMEAAELAVWERLGFVQKQFREIYDLAVSLGKRIVVIQDTQLPESFVRSLLKKNGYEKVDALALSHQIGACSTDGSLFERLLAQLGLAPGEMAHIGSSLQDDYYMAQDKGIIGLWLAPEETSPGSEAVAGLLMGFARCYLAMKQPDEFGSFVVTHLGALSLAIGLALLRLRETTEIEQFVFPAGSSRALEGVYRTLGDAFTPHKASDSGEVAQFVINPGPEQEGAGRIFLYPPARGSGALSGHAPGNSALPALIAALLGDQTPEDFAFFAEASARQARIRAVLEDMAAIFAEKFRPWLGSLITSKFTSLEENLLTMFEPGDAHRWDVLACLPTNGNFLDSAFLREAVAESVTYPTAISGTKFETYRHPAPNPAVPLPALRIGLHVHLWHLFLYQEFLHLLGQFPVNLDLYLTLRDQRSADLARVLFSGLPTVNKLETMVLPNRGRDLSAWLVGMRGIQENYDLFGHIHAKYSPQTPMASEWRDHLLTTLLGRDSVLRILRQLNEIPQIGCIFPRPSPWWHETIRKPRTTLVYKDMHRTLAPPVLEKMGINKPLLRSELLFSLGAMYWYRPDALRQFFTMPLTWEDFPEEPLPPDGTFAHAVERLFPFVAEYNGYQNLML